FLKGKYGLELDYSNEPLDVFNVNQKVNLSLKYYMGSQAKLIEKKIEFKKKQAKDIAKDIVLILNEALTEYKLEHGEYPLTLDLLLPLLKQKFDLNQIPRPDQGYIAYDSLLGKIE